jgi:hypothetical protein
MNLWPQLTLARRALADGYTGKDYGMTRHPRAVADHHGSPSLRKVGRVDVMLARIDGHVTSDVHRPPDREARPPVEKTGVSDGATVANSYVLGRVELGAPVQAGGRRDRQSSSVIEELPNTV